MFRLQVGFLLALVVVYFSCMARIFSRLLSCMLNYACLLFILFVDFLLFSLRLSLLSFCLFVLCLLVFQGFLCFSLHFDCFVES